MMNRARVVRIALPLLATTLVAAAFAGTLSATVRWGDHGHRISGRAAATNLPAEMPGFFRDAVGQLEYLNPEPDRWRNRTYVAMDDAYEYDHFIDLEIVPDSALAAVNRYAYLAILERSGVDNAARAAGLLPFRILELYERLIVEFALWRRTLDEEARGYIEQRIINDAGLLGHYVSDGANPHHATIHYNGWAEGAPNPNDFTLDRTFHRRFESDFVGAQVSVQDLLPHVSPSPRRISDARTEIMAFLRASNAQVVRLYELEKAESFQATTTAAAHKRFAVDRLVAGVEMLRSLWFSAWQESANFRE